MTITQAGFRLPRSTFSLPSQSSITTTVTQRQFTVRSTGFPIGSANRVRYYTVDSHPRGDLIDELDKRGLIHTLTSRSLRTHLATASRTVYSGVDPSAPSLHVGNLLPLLTLVHFARYNHRPIVLVGGATGSIGDPSGRSTERNALDQQTLNTNVEAITKQLKTFFQNVHQYYQPNAPNLSNTKHINNTGEHQQDSVALGLGVRLMNNYDWMSSVTLLDFLGSVGRHARLTHMLARDSVASRLSASASASSSSSSLSPSSSGMSYTEFSYQLLQAYDFSYLHRSTQCTIQIGGSDQLGNISAGIDLIRRTCGGLDHLSDPAYGLTLPLLTTSSGEKFGKSAGNAIWLSSDLTPDFEFYQFFLRSSDTDVARYLYTLTLLDPHQITQILADHQANPKLRIAQKVLADHMTRLIRGPLAAQKAKSLSDILFSPALSNGNAEQVHQATKIALAKLDLSTLTQSDQILVDLHKDQVVDNHLTKVVVAAGLVKSRAEAKRLLDAGGLYLNNRQVLPNQGEMGAAVVVKQHDLVPIDQTQARGGGGGGGGGGLCLLRAGKGAVKVIHVSNSS